LNCTVHVNCFLFGPFADALIGLPALSSRDLDEKLREERSKYLTAELTARPQDEEPLYDFCDFVKDTSLALDDVTAAVRESSCVVDQSSAGPTTTTRVDVGAASIDGMTLRLASAMTEKSPRLPYVFATPRGTECDLRLFDR
jgi:hypothetical protein